MNSVSITFSLFLKKVLKIILHFPSHLLTSFGQGEHLEWLGCALYVAGQNLSLESVEGETLHGNNISLTQILRATKLK